MSKWWQRPQRIVQTNLRLVDASLDPEAVAESLVELGATAMLFNVGGIFAWYDTQLPLQPRNPLLAEGDDLLARMVAAAHRRDIRVIGRYDLSKGTRIAYEAHPEWFCRDEHGAPFEYNGTYQACVNGGWYHTEGIEVLRETLSRYEIDGLFFNMFGYLAVDYSLRAYGLCHCENCRRGFREFAGAELPARRDLADPVYRKYLQFQDVTSQALAASIYDVVRAIRPEAAISNMGKKSDFFRGEVNRRLDRPQPEWPYFAGEQARNFRSLGANRIRHSSALTHFIDFPWRYSAETGAAQALRLAQQLANGADPHYYFMGSPEQADRKPLPALRQVFSMHKANEALYEDLASEARIALYTSHRSRRYDPRPGHSIAAFRGAYAALLESGLVFDTIHDSRATEPDFAQTHAGYDTIVISGAACLSQAETEALDRYVTAGGTLLVIGDAGSHDETGAPAEMTRLRSLPIEAVSGSRDMRGGYVRVPAGAVGALDSELILLDGPYQIARPRADAKSLYRVLLPQRFGPPELCYPEPDADSDLPGVLIGTFGKGRCIFVPWEADVLYGAFGLAEHRALIADLASRFTRPPLVRIEGPGRVELTVQRNQRSGDLLVHVVNYSGQNGNTYADPVPIHGMRLVLNGVAAHACRTLVSGTAIRPEDCVGGGVSVTLPPVGSYEVIAIELEQASADSARGHQEAQPQASLEA